MKYIIVGPTIINDIYDGNTLIRKEQLGGAIFALEGALIWDDSLLYVSNVGKDFDKFYGNWMNTNDVSFDGLFYTLPHTQYTSLTYDAKELHSEVSIYGSEEEALVESLDFISANQLLENTSTNTKGIYIEISDQDPFWNSLVDFRRKRNAKFLWEIRTSSTESDLRRKKTLSLIPQVDFYSLNLPEAQSLFEIQDENQVVKTIQQLGIPCYLRMGSRGSAVVLADSYTFMPSLSLGKVIDTTGCGNASTAAAMIGFVEGFSSQIVAKMGNISAWYNLLQYGPHPNIPSIRKEAHSLL